RVAVLLVVVDQARVRRRGDDGVERPIELQPAGVAVAEASSVCTRAGAGERLDPRQRVEGVAPDEVIRSLDRPALALVLVAPVRLALRRAGEVEVEVRRQPRGPRGAG